MVVAAVPSPSDGLSAMYQARASASGKSGRFTRASTYGAGKVRCMSIPFAGMGGRSRPSLRRGTLLRRSDDRTPEGDRAHAEGTRTNRHAEQRARPTNRTPLADNPSSWSLNLRQGFADFSLDFRSGSRIH